MCGVYPASGVRTAGDEISSTYEGRHVTMRDDELLHKYTGATDDGFVDKGDAVILCKAGNGAYGKAVGVALADGVASSDLIAVDTEGIWALLVYADDDIGGSEVVPGDELFIDCVTAQEGAAGVGIGCLSKIRNIATQIPFGYALGNIASLGEGVIAVKVHFDPMLDSERILYNTVVSGGEGKRTVGILVAGHAEGIAHSFVSQVSGQQDGLTYGVKNWMELAADFKGTGTVTTPWDTGIYNAVGADISASRLVFAGQHMAILDAAPFQMYAWRLNVAAAAGHITALIQAGNIQSVGYIAAVTETADPIGYIPLAFIAGIAGAQPCYVRVYTGTD